MWTILSPIWSKLWGARVFLGADCVRRIPCLGHARLGALPAQRIRLSCQRPKIHLAPVSLSCSAGAHLLAASGGLSVWVMHAYVHSPHRKPAVLVSVQKILLARGTVQGRERSAHGCCILQQTDFLFGACTSVCAPSVPAFMAASLYIPCSILRSNEWRNGVPKIKRLWETDLPSGQFPTTFLQQN